MKAQYSVEAIREVPMVVAVPADHRFAKRKSIDLTELAEESFVTLHDDFFSGQPKMMKKMFERAGISPAGELKVGGLSELLGQVGGGAGNPGRRPQPALGR